MAINFIGKIGVFGRHALFVTLAFQHRLEYRNADELMRNPLNVATSCTHLVMFGEVTPKIYLLIFIII